MLIRSSHRNSVQDRDYLIIVGTLAAVMISVITVLLMGLFVDKIDNNKVFEILGPAFQTIVGCFVGLISGRMINKV